MDLRDFISLCEQAGQPKRIKAEVDWDLELSHVSKLNKEKTGPALLFENVKGHKSPVLTGAFTSASRLALALGKSSDLSMAGTEYDLKGNPVRTYKPIPGIDSGKPFMIPKDMRNNVCRTVCQ